METAISVLLSKEKRLTTAVEQKNVSEAISIAKDIISFALEQCSNANNNVHIRDRFKESAKNAVAILGKFADRGASRASDASTAAESEEKDDPYYTEKEWFSQDVPNLGWNDIIGVQEAKDAFMVDVVAPLNSKYKDVYKKFRGNNLQSQYLLYGPPGTGKTHIVKCLAGALGCKIAVVQTSEILASVVGVGEKHMRAIFDQASKLDKCIIFFDEIDSIASGRETNDSSHTKSILTTMLTCMDGFTKEKKDNQLRIVIAATNRPWILDSAIKRGGRFETQIYVGLPDVNARKMFVSNMLKGDGRNVPCDPKVTVDILADMFKNFSGADINAAMKQIINLPLRREIYNINSGKGEKGEVITMDDCKQVISNYINCVTKSMLWQFDAYRKNIDYNEYLLKLQEQLDKKKKDKN